MRKAIVKMLNTMNQTHAAYEHASDFARPDFNEPKFQDYSLEYCDRIVTGVFT